jgi:hypothetical protein
MNSAATDHQSTGPRPRRRHRGSTIKARATAPDMILTDVKLAVNELLT